MSEETPDCFTKVESDVLNCFLNFVNHEGSPEDALLSITALIDERIHNAVGKPRKIPMVTVPAMPPCSVAGCGEESVTHAVSIFNGGEPVSRYLCEKHLQEDMDANEASGGSKTPCDRPFRIRVTDQS